MQIGQKEGCSICEANQRQCKNGGIAEENQPYSI